MPAGRAPKASRERCGVSGGEFGTQRSDAVRHDVGLRRPAGLRCVRGECLLCASRHQHARAGGGAKSGQLRPAVATEVSGTTHGGGRGRAASQADARARAAATHVPHEPHRRYSGRTRRLASPSISSRCGGSPDAAPPSASSDRAPARVGHSRGKSRRRPRAVAAPGVVCVPSSSRGSPDGEHKTQGESKRHAAYGRGAAGGGGCSPSYAGGAPGPSGHTRMHRAERPLACLPFPLIPPVARARRLARGPCQWGQPGLPKLWVPAGSVPRVRLRKRCRLGGPATPWGPRRRTAPQEGPDPFGRPVRPPPAGFQWGRCGNRQPTQSPVRKRRARPIREAASPMAPLHSAGAAPSGTPTVSHGVSW